MPRRSILSAAERESLLALPDTKDDLIRHYSLSDSDLSIIRQRRGPANRLGFAVQLCYLRFPGILLGVDQPLFLPLLKLVADQLKVGVESWNDYGQREQTRREHLVELQTVFGFQPFTMSHYRQAVQWLTELAMQTDKGVVLASALVDHLRRQSVILPAINAVERATAEAITRANRRIYDALAEPLSDAHRRRLDAICSSAGTTAKRPGWPGCASHRSSPIRGTCWSTSNASRRGRHLTCLLASSGWFTRTGYSRSPVRAVR